MEVATVVEWLLRMGARARGRREREERVRKSRDDARQAAETGRRGGFTAGTSRGRGRARACCGAM